MYNRIFIGCLLLLILFACKNEDKKPADTGASTKDSLSEKQSLTDTYFFKTMEGTIAGKPVVMHIVKAADRIDANYYYVEQGQTIFLTRNWEKTSGDSVYLIEITNITSGKSPSLAMAISADGIKGTWTSGDATTSYPIDLKESAIQPSIKVVAIGAVDSAQYLKFKKDTPTLKTAVSVIAAADENQAWLNEKVKGFLGAGSKGDNPGLPMQQVVNNKVKQAVDGYGAEVDSSIVGIADDGPHYFLNREYEAIGNVLFNQNGYLVLSMYSYAYTGGAHGNYGTSMYCFDVTARKQLSLGDLLSIDSITMQQLLEQHYRKQYAVPASTPLNTRLFVKKLEPNNNFYFSPKGLGFSYAPYEIASYADGEIKVWIPFAELKPYLNADFVKRMQL
jgi:hypothetical protein